VARVKSRVCASRLNVFFLSSHYDIDRWVMSHAITHLTRLPSEIWSSIFRSVIEKDLFESQAIHQQNVKAFATCLTVSRHWKVRQHSARTTLLWTDSWRTFDRRLLFL
jgi:hypothetical protein